MLFLAEMFRSKSILFGLTLLTMFGLGYYSGGRNVQQKWEDYKQKEKILGLEFGRRQNEVSSRLETSSVAVQTKLQTIFKDRIRYQLKEIPHEIIIKENASCVIPNRFVGLWNSANRAESIPPAPSEFDETSNTVELSDISAQHDAEAELCHGAINQLIGLQTWVHEQESLSSNDGKEHNRVIDFGNLNESGSD